jgi:hypothetical protein
MAVAIERMSGQVKTCSRVGVVLLAVTAAVGAAVGAGSAMSACAETTAVNTAFVSGIFINHIELLDNGDIGCGLADADVYKYVAVAIDDNRNIGGAGVFDCFADGVFGNLPGTDASALNFAVWVYLYNKAQWDTANANGALTSAVATLNGVNQPDGSVIPVSVGIVPDGGTRSKGYPAALSALCLSRATWTTACSATTQPGVQGLADCDRLSLEGSTPRSCALPVFIPDGGHD